MLTKALEAGIETEHTRKCIRLLGIPPDERAQVLEDWPWPVKIHTLGRFALLIDDQTLAFGHKAPKRTIALLKAMIAFGGRGVSMQRLIDALWPETEGDAAQKAFDIALHRLRRLLRYPDALQIQEGRLTLNDKVCWVDTWAFERLLADAETAHQNNAQAGIERGLALYHGAFLADETEAAWSASLRERLRAKFIHHVARLANKRADSGNFEAALKLYQRGLEADDLAEEFYQGVMRCYRSLDRHAEALAVYRRLRQTLSITLGIPPSPASQALFRALQGE
jgi:DNA-binding SARP family transcriptional activator